MNALPQPPWQKLDTCTMLENILAEELQSVPRPDRLLTVQRGKIEPYMRQSCMTWIQEMVQIFSLSPETTGCACNLFDRFLSAEAVIYAKLHVISAACLLISTKLHETCPPSVQQLSDATNKSFTPDDIISAEVSVLGALGWDVNCVTAHNLLGPLILCAVPEKDQIQRLHLRAAFYVDVGLYDMMLASTLPSVLASAALLCADGSAERPSWYKALLQSACIKDSEALEDCRVELIRAFEVMYGPAANVDSCLSPKQVSDFS